ncbi:metaxin-1 isoform X2 [Pararge aegeria]|uniref:Jg16417 protein n=1 Tax=Pararge aegeria aegeria TaxID=348720 RepID=A0A8S4SQG8_9NEOP|nr:metaxin-1 isoform X2 [Pararge aegeria]CAH2269391.1 jg16417 [Pararge aegeria aegeria]
MASIELDIWRGEWGLASIDLECLKVLTYMKFIGVPVKVREASNPFFTPKGTLPVMRDGRTVLTNFEEVVAYLKSLHYSTDVHLNQKQAAEASAFTQYLRDKLYPAYQYAWWVDEKNYGDITRPAYAKALQIPFNFYYPSKYQSSAKAMVDALFGEHTDLKEIEKTIYSEAEKCLKTLSDRLGESEYFFGNRPSSFDAIVFAYLAPLVKAPFSNATLANHVKGIANLSRFVARIGQKNFRSVTDDYNRVDSKKKSQGTQSEREAAHFPHQTRNKLLAAVFAALAMTGYAVANGMFQDLKDFEHSQHYNDMFENEEDDN